MPTQEPADIQTVPALPHGLKLRKDERGLVLVGADGMELIGDFSQMARRIQPAKLAHELIWRAVKIKGVDHLRVIDATAGLGEDSFLLAAAGAQVTLCERDPTIAALLKDALLRAEKDQVLAPIVSRMELLVEDSTQLLARVGTERCAPDVVFLDPMFPARQKSALVKKKLQLIQRLEQPCQDEQELMSAAWLAHPRKIVVKRPAKGPYLAGAKPSYSLAGKAVRFDCYVNC
ncbi:MAG: class I SAM-dependent methyltransferase [Atopobiaceae bacterium]